MSNPESRVVMIGNKQQLQRVQTIFKESMFGPDPEQLYIDEEICPVRKSLGYKIDFIAEKAVLAFRGTILSLLFSPSLFSPAFLVSLVAKNDTRAGPDGNEVTVADFASFIAFDERGVATTTGARQKKRKFVEGDGEEAPSSSGTSSHLFLPLLHSLLSSSHFCVSLSYFAVIKIVNSGGLIKFYEDGVLRGTVDSSLPPPPKHAKVFPALQAPFMAPTLGVTFLGTSHGFDPNVCTKKKKKKERKKRVEKESDKKSQTE
jgi:hypothetical protein